jgi:hypothetical protein
VPKKFSRDEIIAHFQAVHGERYDYSQVVYKNTVTKITVVCTSHGSFEIAPGHHKNGTGCAKCYFASQRISRADFIARSREQHGDRYDYYRALKRREAGMSDEHIFERETLRHLRRVNEVAVDGHDYPNLGAAVRHIRPPATATTIARWLADGMTPEEAFTRVPNPGVKDGAIYLITHRESGKKYVGLTVQSIERRWTYHQQQAQAGWIKSLEGLHAAICGFRREAGRQSDQRPATIPI